MPYATKTFVIPSFVIAGLEAAVLGIPAAAAQERITLEAIGAVRMTRVDEVRRANPPVRPMETAPERDQAAERPSKAR
jgi:hypothetical protein